jgi:hypothetical protein
LSSSSLILLLSSSSLMLSFTRAVRDCVRRSKYVKPCLYRKGGELHDNGPVAIDTESIVVPATTAAPVAAAAAGGAAVDAEWGDFESTRAVV